MAFQIVYDPGVESPLKKFDTATIIMNLNRICNNIYKLLPTREEDQDWLKPLDTLYIETVGLLDMMDPSETCLALISKLNGLRKEGEQVEFILFRRTVFECCGLVNKIKDAL